MTRLNLISPAINVPYTPVIAFGGASVGVTYSLQEGFATQNANRMRGSFVVNLSSKGSSTGTLTVTLPALSNSASGYRATAAVRANNLSAAISATPQALINSNASTMSFTYLVAGSTNALTDAEVLDTLSLIGSFEYLL